MIKFIIDININDRDIFKRNLFKVTPQSLRKIIIDEAQLYVWGDPILNDEIELHSEDDKQINEILNKIYGHYYYLMVKEHTCYIGNSIFSVLPVYYTNSKKVLISNSSYEINRVIENNEISKRFILENILFNYPLFNHSCYSDISLLPANSYIKIKDGEFSINKHTHIEDYFVESPRNWKKSVDYISDLFIDTSQKYFPVEQASYALTGGFDGRTLVSCSLSYGNKFDTFCFGSKDSDDIIIGKYIADRLGINFKIFDLNDKYVELDSKINGLEFIRNASGATTFARAHYLYAAKELASEYRYIVTGNFGNEILQTSSVFGVITPPNIYNLFASNSFDEAIEKIKNSQEYAWLNKSRFSQEWESLLADLRILPSFDKKYSILTKTQKYYLTRYEETLRKYFGAEMVNHLNYICNRTPFLDFYFLKELLKTELAAANGEFFMRNPIKRYKGQVIYGHIIRKTTPMLGKLKSSWGYSPDDLVSTIGKLKIFYGYFKRRGFIKGIINSPQRYERKRNQKSKIIDPFGVNNSFLNNMKYFRSLDIDRELFNYDMITNSFDEKRISRQFYATLSQVYWHNYINQTHKK